MQYAISIEGVESINHLSNVLEECANNLNITRDTLIQCFNENRNGLGSHVNQIERILENVEQAQSEVSGQIGSLVEMLHDLSESYCEIIEMENQNIWMKSKDFDVTLHNPHNKQITVRNRTGDIYGRLSGDCFFLANGDRKYLLTGLNDKKTDTRIQDVYGYWLATIVKERVIDTAGNWVGEFRGNCYYDTKGNWLYTLEW